VESGVDAAVRKPASEEKTDVKPGVPADAAENTQEEQ